jgi:pimeloyl-ACP methyl ester carboxylesterase
MPAPLLLIPCLVCDHSVWSPLLPFLNKELKTHTTDHGGSDSLIDMAGHSMGGRVALEVYRLAPERVGRIALMNTGYSPLVDGEAGLKERAGHMLTMEQPEAVAQVFLNWLN